MISIRTIFLFYILIHLSVINALWQPISGLTWNWVLGENPNKLTIKKNEFDVIDIDLFDATKSTINDMHNLGLKVICYFSAGTYEPFREEAKGMKNIKGLVRTKMEDWDEYWLDYRIEELKPFIMDFLDVAQYKGCDGVEFDNVDAYSNTEWKDALTEEDQIKYNRWLAQEAHSRNLAAGLKNCIELLDILKDDFDFTINEECSDYEECKEYTTFLNSNKPVFVALYGLVTNKKFVSKVCSEIDGMKNGKKLSIIIKDPNQNLEYPYTQFIYEEFCEYNSSVKNLFKK
ncbi:hypothetical protein BCR32DRAFT_268528 [Anaeromyces robustus]|uniref:alpha-galactosidase n=1 Tax=Anaeromyces robustus TaxID=1754192 RepID=A0A1Y1X6J9_9FUNG|nr:hypothetical protein BCR32DRAFT_268528 [Anaeromyces robustus]|eukprot:ORX81006.1 hypothetical protein BCR32DRAFT_268528 [Anaeromyces robustus]